MNEQHLVLCSSLEWGEYLRDQLLPWALDGIDLGDDVIEVGPGPGLTTDILRQRVRNLTAVEAEPQLAAALADRLRGLVTVQHADATDLPFAAATFTAGACFTMLHHVPSIQMQDRLLAELARVVVPDGVLVGVDSMDSEAFQALHAGDTCVPVDPVGLTGRLISAGWAEPRVTTDFHRMRFIARRA